MSDNNKSALMLFQAVLGILAWAAIGVEADSKLPDTLARIKPGIVAVGTYLPKRSPRANFLGTGFVVGQGNLVVTNAHVVPESLDTEHLERIAIFFRQGNEEKMQMASEVALDKDHDLAVLKITDPLPALKLGDAALVKEGQVYAFTGYPIGMVLGLYPVTHRGMVSAISPNVIPTIKSGQINPKLLRRLEAPYNIFQLDATAYPGNSGSPLYDVDSGAVVGVIDKVFVQESKENVLSNPSGIAYAIPVNYVLGLLKDNNLH
ncbi:MAG: serine protease [Methylovulum sp.]|uniref:S1 family peptidase n=1 Tax=Methylovulum sp. TaxID=1916980 RepID=UPI0026250249|nr:serine protease [Methylovulum sp.]MDD2724803.1 serine protease [Methylovulum sp.]MDD5126111.1 serine protease [Methylovulum sp.]